MSIRYSVEIVDDETGEVVETMGPTSKHRAEKILDGVCINLNHEKYSVDIVEAAKND